LKFIDPDTPCDGPGYFKRSVCLRTTLVLRQGPVIAGIRSFGCEPRRAGGNPACSACFHLTNRV